MTTNVEGKHTKVPASRYSNSKVLSDVTIRYGASSELKFEAQRLLLSAQSRWFEAAFTGGFAVGLVSHDSVHTFNEVHRRAMPERSL